MSKESLQTRLAVLEVRLEAMQAAQMLQAKEDARRLDELNHAHQQRVERDAEFLSRESYETRHTQLDIRIAALEKQQSRLFGIGFGVISLTAIVLWVVDRFLK